MRGLVAVGVGIGVVAVLAVIAVAASAGRGPSEFAPDSAEAALQGYLQAFEAEDYEAAYAYFSADVQAQMAFEEFEQWARDYRTYGSDSRRVLLEPEAVYGIDGGETATLRLTVEVSYGDVLFADRYSYRTEVHLLREDGPWRIDQPLLYLDPAPVPEPALPPAPVD